MRNIAALLLFGILPIQARMPVTVQVLIHAYDLRHPKSAVVNIHADDGCVVKTQQWLMPELSLNTNDIRISVNQRGMLRMNNRSIKYDEITFTPRFGHLVVNDVTYSGSIRVGVYNRELLVINEVDGHDYLVSVLRSEGWPGWPLEVYKVFAVACRTYVMHMMEQARQQKLPYHIKNTNAHQTYKGHHTSPRLERAVDETAGMILIHDRKPITAMFDSCCGSIIPARMLGIDYQKAPYLARKYACNYCESYKIYSWKTDYTFVELTQKCKSDLPTGFMIRDISISKKDDAGVVQELLLRNGRGKRVHITGKRCYALLPNVKSYAFNVEIIGDSVHFSGVGFGHHVGLCQWGARQMVTQGFDFYSILSFYYPGTKLVRLASSSM